MAELDERVAVLEVNMKHFKGILEDIKQKTDDNNKRLRNGITASLKTCVKHVEAYEQEKQERLKKEEQQERESKKSRHDWNVYAIRTIVGATLIVWLSQGAKEFYLWVTSLM